MDPKQFGAFLSAERKAKNLTQKDLAEKLGVTDKAISKWERGVCLPDVAKFDDIAAALGVTDVEVLRAHRLPPEAKTTEEKAPPFVTRRELGRLLLGWLAVMVARFFYEMLEVAFTFHIIALGPFLAMTAAAVAALRMGRRRAEGVGRVDQRGLYLYLLCALAAALLLLRLMDTWFFHAAPAKLTGLDTYEDSGYIYGGFRWEARYLGYWFLAFCFFDWYSVYTWVIFSALYPVAKLLRIRRNAKKQTGG